MATKIIAPGYFLEITPSVAMVYDKLYGLQKKFWRFRCLVCGERLSDHSGESVIDESGLVTK